MTHSELEVRERTVEVSPEILAQICPELQTSVSVSVIARAALRRRIRLSWIQIRFRIGDLGPLRCRLVHWRMKLRLAWMKLRHRGRLS